MREATFETRGETEAPASRWWNDRLAVPLVVVKVDGEKALATYRMRGVAHLKGERVPRGGRLQFMVWEGRWQIAG